MHARCDWINQSFGKPVSLLQIPRPFLWHITLHACTPVTPVDTIALAVVCAIN